MLPLVKQVAYPSVGSCVLGSLKQFHGRIPRRGGCRSAAVSVRAECDVRDVGDSFYPRGGRPFRLHPQPPEKVFPYSMIDDLTLLVLLFFKKVFLSYF